MYIKSLYKRINATKIVIFAQLCHSLLNLLRLDDQKIPTHPALSSQTVSEWNEEHKQNKQLFYLWIMGSVR